MKIPITTYHLGTSVEGLLRNMKGKRIDFMEDDDGNALTDKQARISLAELQAKGQGIKETEGLESGQLLLCRCPEWNDEGYQVATWNGDGFEYGGQPNDMFSDLVIAFMLLDEDGEPTNT